MTERVPHADLAARPTLIDELEDACLHPRYVDYHLSPCWRCVTCRAAAALGQVDAQRAAVERLLAALDAPVTNASANELIAARRALTEGTGT